jgi:ABC-type uncharacterized transport system substrate-binding protein
MAALCAVALAASAAAADYRVLHIMSYHGEWEWNRAQFTAFKQQLADLDVEYRVIEMDTKRRSDPEWTAEISAEAQRAIEDWRPDLVYSNDDNAQKHVVAPFPEDRTTFVFSAVNADPEAYGFDDRSDVTGVLEREHILQTLRLLREIAPDTRRIAVLLDDGPTWPGLVARMQGELEQRDDIEVVSYDTVATFAEYKRLVRGYQDSVDALGVLGVFTLKDEHGQNVPYEEVLRWTAENSALPDFSFWGSRMDLGTLCAVTVSAEAQGEAAGRMARRILVDGVDPREIAMAPTLRGEPVVSLARARSLGVKLSSSTLLTSRVVTEFAWR